MKKVTLIVLGMLLLVTGGMAQAERAPRPERAPGSESPARPEAGGELDPTFGGFDGDGKLALPDFEVGDIAVQNDAKIVIAGFDHANDEGVLARRLPDGSADLAFGNGGQVRLPFVFGALYSSGVGRYSPAQRVAVQSDGKLLFVGSSQENAGSSLDFLLARFMPDGTPDLSFGANGVVTTDFGGEEDEDSPNALTLQPDGKILLGGHAGFDFGLARYHVDGSLDAAFGGDGRVITDFDTGAFGGERARIEEILLQPDGKILAGGTYDDDFGATQTDFNFALARYHADGTLDSSFDGDGKAGINFLDGESDSISALAYLPGGKILAIGKSGRDSAGARKIAIARYHPNGNLDNSFNGNGRRAFNVGVDDATRDVWVQPDGKYLLLVDLGSTGNISLPALVRLLPDSTVDTTFGIGGTLPIAAEGGAGRLAVQPDGKFLISDKSRQIAGETSFLYRLLPNFDFDEAGQAVTDFAAREDDFARAIAVQPDGKIVVAGAGAAVPTARDVAVARYHPGGTPDTTFGTFGMAFFATNLDEFGQALAIQPDGKIVVAGHASVAGDYDFAVYRLTAGGQQDRPPFDPVGFNAVGYRLVDVAGGDDLVSAVALLPDGKILLGGYAETGKDEGSFGFALARLLPGGRTDFSFGEDGKTLTPIGDGFVQARSMLILPDGRILLGGGRVVGSAEGQFTLAMYTADGRLDTTFGPDNTGVVEFGFNDASGFARYDLLHHMLLLPTGDILLSGRSDSDWAHAVINADGSLVDYGIEWPLLTRWPVDAYPAQATLQDDGKVVVVGGAINALLPEAQHFVARYQFAPGATGPDSTFGDDGQVLARVQERSVASGVAISGDDIYVAGLSDNGEDFDFSVVNVRADDMQPILISGHRVYLPAVAR